MRRSPETEYWRSGCMPGFSINNNKVGLFADNMLQPATDCDSPWCAFNTLQRRTCFENMAEEHWDSHHLANRFSGSVLSCCVHDACKQADHHFEHKSRTGKARSAASATKRKVEHIRDAASIENNRKITVADLDHAFCFYPILD